MTATPQGGDPRFTIRRATVDDAEAYARCRETAMQAAYAHFMPQEFFDQRQATFADLVDGYHRDLVARDEDVASGNTPFHDFWVGCDSAGEVVALCTIAAGPAAWEHELGVPTPPVQRELAQLYLVPSAQGTGLAHDLLATALPPHLDAYLWCMWKNPRAERFYQRHGFVHEGLEVECGPTWFHQRMFRMWRPAHTPTPDPVKG